MILAWLCRFNNAAPEMDLPPPRKFWVWQWTVWYHSVYVGLQCNAVSNAAAFWMVPRKYDFNLFIVLNDMSL